jgi:hypothetical protein
LEDLLSNNTGSDSDALSMVSQEYGYGDEIIHGDVVTGISHKLHPLDLEIKQQLKTVPLAWQYPRQHSTLQHPSMIHNKIHHLSMATRTLCLTTANMKQQHLTLQRICHLT